MMFHSAFLLFLALVLTTPRCYGQHDLHPLVQHRDSIRMRRIAAIEVWSDSLQWKVQEHAFDRRGRTVRFIQYGLAGEPTLVQQYTYRGRRATLQQTYTSGQSVQQTTYLLQYDARGRLLQQSTRNGSGEKVTTRYLYGANGLPVSYYSQYQGHTTDSAVYTYQGRLPTHIHDRFDRHVEFIYDGQGRLLTRTETYRVITNANYEPGFQLQHQLQYTYSYRLDGLPDEVGFSLGRPGHAYLGRTLRFTYRFYP